MPKHPSADDYIEARKYVHRSYWWALSIALTVLAFAFFWITPADSLLAPQGHTFKLILWNAYTGDDTFVIQDPNMPIPSFNEHASWERYGFSILMSPAADIVLILLVACFAFVKGVQKAKFN